VVRQVHPLPRRDGSNAPPPGQDRQGRRLPRRPGASGAALSDGARDQSVRPGPDGPQSRAEHPPLLPQRVRGPPQEAPPRARKRPHAPSPASRLTGPPPPTPPPAGGGGEPEMRHQPPPRPPWERGSGGEGPLNERSPAAWALSR